MLITSNQGIETEKHFTKVADRWLCAVDCLFHSYLALPYRPYLPKVDWSHYWEQRSGNSCGAQCWCCSKGHTLQSANYCYQ